MRKVSSFLVATLVAGFMAVTGTASASETIWVHPGQSIQEAVERAHPGDTIVVTAGTYHESVQIRHNHLTLIGQDAVIVPPTQAPQTLCTRAFGSAGFCVLAKELNEQTGVVSTPVVDDTIRGFTINGFDDFGVVTYGSRRTLVKNVQAHDNGEYGITSFNSSHNRFIDSVATGSGEAGFYFGDSPNADAVIHGNIAHDNLFGILIRNASEGTISENKTYENCLGTLFVAGAPGPVRDWTFTENRVRDNDKPCPATEETPPISGVGVYLAGTDHVRVTDNRVVNNHPKGASPVSGGIVVGTSFASPIAPTNNLVKNNVVRRNQPVDISYDGTGSNNRFVDNRCDMSSPASICS